MFICYLVHIFLKNLKKNAIRMKIFEKKKERREWFCYYK